MKRGIGGLLILIGIMIGLSNYIDWHVGRSSAVEITNKEMRQYIHDHKDNQPKTLIKERDLQTQTSNSTIQTQIPSIDVQHRLGEKVAMLIIPKLGQKFSVYWGADENVLKKGVGMFVSHLTTAPDGGGHTVLSGHRDTVFYKLKEVKEGDHLKLEYDGSSYSYKVRKIWITDAEDQSVIIKKDEQTLTLTTCYPFNYFGDAPKRYIIQASLSLTSSKRNQKGL